MKLRAIGMPNAGRKTILGKLLNEYGDLNCPSWGAATIGNLYETMKANSPEPLRFQTQNFDVEITDEVGEEDVLLLVVTPAVGRGHGTDALHKLCRDARRSSARIVLVVNKLWVASYLFRFISS